MPGTEASVLRNSVLCKVVTACFQQGQRGGRRTIFFLPVLDIASIATMGEKIENFLNVLVMVTHEDNSLS